MQTLTKTDNKKKKKIEYVCFNPNCFQNALLERYKSNTDRPIIFLASVCWNCHTNKFLRVKE